MRQRGTQLLATALLVPVVLGAAARPAAAAPGSYGCTTFLDGRVVCHVGSQTGTPGGRAPRGSGSASTGSAPAATVTGARLGANPRTGAKCYILVTVDAAGLTKQQIADIEFSAGALEGVLPACPDQPKRAAMPTVTPAQLAAEYWYRIHLPVPEPHSRPDYATTGKPTYLEAGDSDDPPSWTRATPLGLLRITAHGTYTVDWGDATAATGPYATPGAPYPTGTITHTYDSTGTVTITVHEQWIATWTIGAAHGTLEQLRTTGALPNFPVRQLQAVITS